MTRCLHGLWIAAILAVPAVAMPRQPISPPSPQQEEQPPPVVRVSTRLVELNVVVHDKKGEPVRNLTRDDFVIKDEGRTQPIAQFSVEANQPPINQPAPLPANVFSNRLYADAGAPSSVTAILLDGLNTSFDDRAYARNQILKFLGQLQPQDRVAIYVLGRGLQVLQDFTSDSSALLQALARDKGALAPFGTSGQVTPVPDLRRLNHFLDDSNQYAAEYFTARRVSMTIVALETIADHLAGFPGRKSLICVSDGIPIAFGFESLPISPSRAGHVTTYFEEVERAARALNNANLAVYPVDARGLVGPDLRINDYSDPRRGLIVGPQLGGFAAMNIIADRTGGRAFHNTNDIRGSIRRAIDDARASYVLGYYPDHGKWDGKFRSIKVELKRPGIELRTRRGYFALPDHPRDAKERHREELEKVVTWLDATGIGLTAKTELKRSAGVTSLTSLVKFDPHQIRFEQQDGRWVAEVRFLYAQRDAHGTILENTDETLQLRLLPASYDKGMNEGLYITKDVNLHAGAAELRIIAEDMSSDAIGSVTIPLTKLTPANTTQ